MSFLTPLFLLGALAIAGPIIYHLVRRTTRERTRFSSLMFLQPSPPRLSKRHRLENILLLILRCLALGLLALGFARPFLRQTPVVDPTGAEPKKTIVLVDQSASMRRAGAWASARERVEQVLRRAGPADQLALYTFDRNATPLVSFEDWNRTAPGDRVAFASARLATVSPGWAGTHLGNAVITAAEALAENDGTNKTGPRQIVLVSDLQAGSRLDTLQAYEWPKDVELFVEPAKATDPTNAGVQLVAEAVDSVRAVDAPVRVRVTNAADSKREEFTLAWTRPAGAAAADGSRRGSGLENIGAPIDAYVPAGQSRVFSLPRSKAAPASSPVPEAAGATPALLSQITLRGDAEEFDNTVYVIPPVQQRATMLWIGADVAEDARQPLFFLRRAFAETPRLAVQIVANAPGAPLRPDDVKAANVIFVSEALPAETAAALREQVLAGKTLVFAPKNIAAAPTLAALLGHEAIAMEDARPDGYAMFAEIDFQHALFAPFSDPRFSDFTKIHIWKYRKMDAGALAGASVLARFDSGDPAVIEAPVGKGRVFVLTTGWHPEDSQLALSSKFVPLMWSLLELGGGIGAVATHYAVGETIALSPEAAATSVRAPDGAAIALREKANEFAGTMQPGIYELGGGPGTSPLRFAVNLDANESRTTPLGADELEQLGVPLAKAGANSETPVATETILQGVEAENRQKLWRWFIVATLVVLLIESAIAGWAARRTAFRTGEVAS